MTLQPASRTQPTPDPEQEYRALRNGLRRMQGFGLFFVQCSPAEGTRLVGKIREDLPQKKVEVLRLTEPITNLYEIVDGLPNKDDLDVLFVQGIEHSLYDYEKNRLWQNPSEQYSYSQKGVPRLIGHLNLSRERFRDNFKICFVFLVPLFALKYLIRRAPDFFDWRSGLLEFAMDADRLQIESLIAQLERSDWEEYRALSPQERRREILKIQALIEEPQQTAETKAELCREQGLLYSASNEFEEAFASYDQLLQYKSDDSGAWSGRGRALFNMGRDEEAIISYDQALQYEPDNPTIWYNRANALNNLGRFEEAIASFDQALQHKPDNPDVWYDRGNTLDDLGRFEEAIASFDQALQHKPDLHQAWHNRGFALVNLGHYEAAVTSFDQVVRYKPDSHEAWNNRGFALVNLERYEEAIASFDKALAIKPDNASALYNKACIYGLQGQVEQAISCLKEAISLDSKYREMAKTDADFDAIRGDDQFQLLLSQAT